MQQKWTDRPPSGDGIDVVLDAWPAFLRAHGSLLAKALPPLVGFGIFVMYFYRNRFYPSFDLFQFSSLLLAAACIGFAIVGAMVVMMVLPGAALFHWFLNTKKIKDELAYAMPYSESARAKTVWQLVLLTYYGPFALVGLGLVTALVSAPGLYTHTGLLWPVLVGLAFGIALQLRFDLPRWSFLNYAWAAYIPFLILFLLLTTVLQSSLPIVDKLDDVWHHPILWAIPLVVAAVVSTCAMGHFAGWNAALLFSLFFGLMAAGYSGVLTTVPERAIKGLGLGAYEAIRTFVPPTSVSWALPRIARCAMCMWSGHSVMRWCCALPLISRGRCRFPLGLCVRWCKKPWLIPNAFMPNHTVGGTPAINLVRRLGPICGFSPYPQ